MQKSKRLLALILALCILIVAVPFSASAAGKGQEYTITPDTTDGEVNKFTYSQSDPGWTVLSSEAYSEVKTTTQDPSSVYVEFYFIGNRIEVYGAKSTLHGIVDFYIDGKKVHTFDSYGTSRQENVQMLAYGYDDGDKPHTVKMVATGNTSTGTERAVAQFSYVKIWHEEYSLIDFTLNDSTELFAGQTKKVIPASTTPSYAALEGAQYTIADTSIATVSSDGKVTGVKSGQTTLTVTCNDVTKTTKVIVKDAVPSLHGIIGDTNVRYGQDTYEDVLSIDNNAEDLTAWKGDKALSQIILLSENSAIKNVNLSVSNFTGTSGTINASNISISFIDETLAYIGTMGYHNDSKGPSTTPTGTDNKELVPDIITGSKTADIEFNSVKGVWVEINVPENTPAGIYNGTVTVTADSIDSLTFNYELKVLDLVMPDAANYTFDVEMWQYPYSIAEYYGLTPFSQEHLDILKTHMEQYRDIGGNAITCTIVDDAWNGQTYSKNEVRYPSMVKWIRETDGSFTYDYSDFDAWVTLNKDLGIGDKIVMYSIASWSGKIRYFDKASNQYVTIKPEVGSDEWKQRWTDLLTSLVAHLEEKGWFDDAYMGIDERGFSSTQFDLIESVKGKNGQHLKSAGAFDSITDANKVALSNRIDDLSIGSIAVKSHNSDYKTLLQQRTAAGLKTTIYTCTEHFPNNLAFSMPGESYWIPFFSASQGAAGYMRWAYDAWVEDPLNDTSHWACEAGDCFQVYPGDDSNGRVTRSSLRLEKLAEGVRDINKLEYLQLMLPGLKSEIDALYSQINNSYSYDTINHAYYASDATKQSLPKDMAALKEGVNTISEKFLSSKDMHPTIPLYDFPKDRQILVDREQGQYLGQPDLVMLDDEKTIITVYPQGHGVGPTVMKISTDGGQTWGDRVSNTPADWQRSQETPTIYKLDFVDGTQKLIMITGCPGTWGDRSTGFNASISNDGGQTWSNYTHFYDGQATTVAMASLIQLKDENGNYIDKWMGVYHHSQTFVNYKTYLTFDADGTEHWSSPEPYLSQWRDIELGHQICEVGMFRSPDGNRIVALARSQSHMNFSTMFYSDDEGNTWSEPRDLPASLLGERHKAIYDPLSGRLYITFREIILDYNCDGVIKSGDWMAGDWLAWVGTYEDLMNGNEGQYRIRLAEDFAATTYSGDTGYAGLCVTSDGTIFTNSYGVFDPADTAHNYILGAKFKLSEIDSELGIMWGDANGDKSIDSMDVTLVLQNIASIPIGGTFNKAVANVDGDKATEITSTDATLILQRIADIIPKFQME